MNFKGYSFLSKTSFQSLGIPLLKFFYVPFYFSTLCLFMIPFSLIIIWILLVIFFLYVSTMISSNETKSLYLSYDAETKCHTPFYFFLFTYTILFYNISVYSLKSRVDLQYSYDQIFFFSFWKCCLVFSLSLLKSFKLPPFFLIWNFKFSLKTKTFIY